MPRERVAALEELAKTSPYWDKNDPPELQLRHDMMRAKLAGFLERPDTVARRYPSSDTSLPARYARAISAYRFGDSRSAIAQIDALIQAQPNNPYFHELKGQALLEGARPAEAIAPLRRAVALAPNAALIRIMLGQALVATGENRYSDEAISLLRVAMQREPDAPDVYTQLAMAYGRKGDLARGRSRLRAGSVRARRHEDRARARGTRQDPFPDRLARLGQGRRHRQTAGRPSRSCSAAPMSPSARSEPDRPAQDRLAMIRLASLLCRRCLCAARGVTAGRRRPSRSRSAARSRRSSRNTWSSTRKCCRRRWRSLRRSSRRRSREGARRGQDARGSAVQLAAPGHARQSAGRRHVRRVLRLQLRLLQARAGRHGRADERIRSSRSC